MAMTHTRRRKPRDIGSASVASSEPLWVSLIRLPNRVAFVLLAIVQIAVELGVAALRTARSERGRRA